MKQNQIVNKEARQELLDGVNIVANIVGSTIGPFGKNVCIDGMITNDGVSIAQAIFLDDANKNVGAYLIKEAAKRTNKNVGDGTTTTVVLTQQLSNKFSALVDSGISGIEIRNAANYFLEKITEELKRKSIKCEDLQTLSHIATISVEDRKIGEMIAKTTLEVGKDGYLTASESKTGDTYVEVFKGLKIERGYVSPFICNDTTRMIAEDINIPVLVTDETIKDFSVLVPILQQLLDKGIKKLFIVCDDMSPQVINNILQNKKENGFNIIAIRGPIGTQRKPGAADIATITGATLFTEDLNNKIEDAKIEDLGSVAKVVAKRNETILINGGGKKKDIDNRIKSLKIEYTETESDYEKEKIQERIARLGSGIGVIHVGGPTEVEQTYLKLKIEDAINATKHAYLSGVTAGSGYGLLEAVNKIPQSYQDADGSKVLKSIIEAIEYPVKKIFKNADWNEIDIIGVILEARKGKYTNIKTQNNYMNPVKEGIIDPTAVVIQAITNAISTASTLITTESLIVNVPEDKDNNEI